MSIIETGTWEPVTDQPNRVRFVPDKTVQAVFLELVDRLKSQGQYPDEYMLMDGYWENGALYPEDAQILQNVDFGGSEGIYLDAYLSYEENGKNVRRNFFTAKTLGESAVDLEKMNLLASAVTLAFQSPGHHDRYIVVDGTRRPQGMTLHLDAEEQGMVAEALLDLYDVKQRWGEPCDKIEGLMRRITGSITEYMQFVGVRPSHMNHFDEAVLAIHDNNLTVFCDAYPKVPQQLGGLLVEAAGHPGRIGGLMTQHLLEDAREVLANTYMEASKAAVRTGDIKRVNLMLDNVERVSPELKSTLFGKLVSYAYLYSDEKFSGVRMAYDMVRAAEPDQIQSIGCSLVIDALNRNDHDFAYSLVSAGVDVTPMAGSALYTAARWDNTWFIRDMVNRGLDMDDYGQRALELAFRDDNVSAALVLADCGADVQKFLDTNMDKRTWDSRKLFFESLERYAADTNPTQGPEQEM